MKTFGNLATTPKTKPRTRRVTRKVVRKKGLPVKEKLLYLGTVIAFVLITSWVLAQHAELTKINYEIQQTEKQIAEIEAEITTLEAEERKLLEPERIMEMARERGLSYSPERVQTAQIEDEEKQED